MDTKNTITLHFYLVGNFIEEKIQTRTQNIHSNT